MWIHRFSDAAAAAARLGGACLGPICTGSGCAGVLVDDAGDATLEIRQLAAERADLNGDVSGQQQQQQKQTSISDRMQPRGRQSQLTASSAYQSGRVTKNSPVAWTQLHDLQSLLLPCPLQVRKRVQSLPPPCPTLR